jgi:hypothetical protein
MMYETAKNAEFAKKIQRLFRLARRTLRSWRFIPFQGWGKYVIAFISG